MAEQNQLFDDDLRVLVDKYVEENDAIIALKKKHNESLNNMKKEHDETVLAVGNALRKYDIKEQVITLTNGTKKTISFHETLQISDYKEGEEE